MSDAIRIEQRLHDLEQRLHDTFASWRRRSGRDHAGDRLSPREMEQEAIKRLYGGRSTVVVLVEHDPGDEDS